MPKVSRRKFIQGASVGAAAVGVLAVGPGLVASQTGTVKQASRGPAVLPSLSGASSRSSASKDALTKTAASEPVMAYVRDPSKGEVAIFVGTREIIRQDPELAARIMHLTA